MLVPVHSCGRRTKCFQQKMYTYLVLYFAPHIRKHFFSSRLYVCQRVQHHVSHRNLAQCNALISTNLKVSLSPGSFSQHRRVFVRAIVGATACFGPTFTPTSFIVHFVCFQTFEKRLFSSRPSACPTRCFKLMFYRVFGFRVRVWETRQKFRVRA